MVNGQDREKEGLAQVAREFAGRFIASVTARIASWRIIDWLKQHDL